MFHASMAIYSRMLLKRETGSGNEHGERESQKLEQTENGK